MSGPTFVYTLSDATGRPLYVGCTSNLPQRLACHRRERHWWPEVRHIRLEHYADRDHGFEVEKQRIYELRPAHNFCHNPAAIGNCYVLPPGPETARDRKNESLRRMHIVKGYAAIFHSPALRPSISTVEAQDAGSATPVVGPALKQRPDAPSPAPGRADPTGRRRSGEGTPRRSAGTTREERR